MATRISYSEYLVTNQSFISVVARLRDNVTLATANAELSAVSTAVQAAQPNISSVAGTTFGATALTLNESRIDPSTRRPLMVLLAAAACLLLLSCANVSGLMLGRAVSRRREMAVRVATGATRAHIVRQMLVESLLLAGTGGVLGVLAAIPMSSAVTPAAAAPRGRNFYGAVGEFSSAHLDVRVVAFCAAVCVVTAIAFGLVPAMRASRVDLTSDLKDGGSGAGLGEHGRIATRQFIVALETSLAVLLLFTGGLLLTTWQRLASADTGFDKRNLLTFMLRPSYAAYPAPKAPALLDKVLAALERVPGVDAVTFDGCAPVSTSCANTVLFIAGRPVPSANDAPPVLRHYIAPDHFRVLRIPLVRGRAFTDADRGGSPHVVIINELAAKRFWPNEDPIGKRVWFGGGSTFDSPDSSAEIVGIVKEVAYLQLDERPFQPDFYTPYRQFTYSSRMVLIRTRGEPTSIVPDVRRALLGVDPTLAMFDVRTMDDRLRSSWSRLTQQTRLLGAFAALAVVLAAIGIFAVIVQVVGDRRQEIGIRAALGASAEEIISVVGGRGALPALSGLAVGVALSVAGGRVVASMVNGAPAFSASVAATVVALALAVILIATYLAARRALLVQPSEALRS
jgi:putative ABC transport system permease protein